MTAARERKRNEKVFETKNERERHREANNSGRTAASERTRAPHAVLLLFIDSGFVPVFAHALRVGGSGCTVAVGVFGSGPCVACVVVSEIPTLAGQYGAPTPGAGDLLAGGHALPPSCALTLVRAPVASLCAAAALMVASTLVLNTVAVTVGYESRAAGVGAPSHMPRLPCLIEDVRGPGRVPRLATPACGHSYNLGRLDGRRLGGCRRHHGPEPRRIGRNGASR